VSKKGSPPVNPTLSTPAFRQDRRNFSAADIGSWAFPRQTEQWAQFRLQSVVDANRTSFGENPVPRRDALLFVICPGPAPAARPAPSTLCRPPGQSQLDRGTRFDIVVVPDLLSSLTEDRKTRRPYVLALHLAQS